MPKFYGIEYTELKSGYTNLANNYRYFTQTIITDKDFHNVLYNAMYFLTKNNDTACIFTSPNDYTHLGLDQRNNQYPLVIKNIIPLIDKSAIRAMIDAEMQKLKEYTNLAELRT